MDSTQKPYATITSPETPADIHTDILLLGGGIAGLYLLKLLGNLGYDCILIEKDQLGSGQTLQSQGIIHGGLKYALGGNLNAESDAIKEMPDRWRKLLAGEETVDLSNTKVIAKTQHMWSAGKLASKFTSFFASKLVRGRIDKLKKDQMPALFQAQQFTGSVYKLTDLVVDTPSLLNNLCQGVEQRILQGEATSFGTDETGNITSSNVTLSNNKSVQIHHQTVIFSAGAGNESLANLADIKSAPMQRRPLHMVMAKHNLPYPLYAHGLGTGSKPRITITSHATDDGKMVWYLGGEIAESGINRDSESQIIEGKKELNALFPWVDFGDTEWATFFVDRAEPLQRGLIKPDCAYAHEEKNAIVTWPTKLTLAPDLGDRILALIKQQGVTQNTYSNELSSLPKASIAIQKWESLFV
ncbi:hypothetical protein A9Q81_08140 [Gammaproteobacteria bacterium 42_54_T18]|nr:hypothetical protein A9Q81_08140 [Gammaproteobacteria bacterium 42_54_T18]